MVPTSANTIDRFTPESSQDDANPPVYLISIPTKLGKAKWRRSVAATGARIWTKEAMVQAAREEIELGNPGNKDEWLEICDRYETADEHTDPELAAAIVKDWVRLCGVLQDAGMAFAGKIADNQCWFEVAPLQAARSFLVGIEPGGAALRRGPDGLIVEASLTALPEADIAAIGWRAIALMQTSETDRKNSASPRPSPSDPANSTAASDLRTEAPGISAAIATSETHA